MINSNFVPAPFLSSSNIYEVNIRQYTAEGTFNAFALHLPRLKSMGVEILWLMPIFPIGKINRKGSLGSYYSISNFTEINAEFGSKNDFQNLVNLAHQLGFKIILDWVANHAAWDNVWTISNPDYFELNANGDFVSPYDWDDVIQINHSNIEQQHAMINAMKYWVTQFDIDGFRADMAHLIPLQFWINARTEIDCIKQNLIWLAETEHSEYAQAFDITYTWEWMHASEKLCKQQISLVEAVQVLKSYVINFPESHLRLFYTSNHDENSWTATEYDKYGDYTKAMAVFSFLYKSVPLIYSGQELPSNKKLLFFDKDVIEWGQYVELQSFYTTLLHLRKKYNLLFEQGKVVFDELAFQNEVMCYTLTYNEKSILVCINFNMSNANYTIPNLQGNYRDVFTDREMYLHHSYYFNEQAGYFLVLEKIA